MILRTKGITSYIFKLAAGVFRKLLVDILCDP